MRIVFLPTTGPDFDWLAEYYLSIFPEGGLELTSVLSERWPTFRTIRAWARQLREPNIAHIQFHERRSP